MPISPDIRRCRELYNGQSAPVLVAADSIHEWSCFQREMTGLARNTKLAPRRAVRQLSWPCSPFSAPLVLSLEPLFLSRVALGSAVSAQLHRPREKRKKKRTHKHRDVSVCDSMTRRWYIESLDRALNDSFKTSTKRSQPGDSHWSADR